MTISHTGEGASALTCHTELTTCCREQDNPGGGALGEWIGPDSNQIPKSSSSDRFFVTRQQSSIRLNIESNNSVGGLYCCVIPRTEGEMTLCVQVYGEHNYVVHSLIKANSVLLQLNSLYFSGLRITNVQSAISKYPIVGFSVAMAVIPVMSAIVVVTLVVIISKTTTKSKVRPFSGRLYTLGMASLTVSFLSTGLSSVNPTSMSTMLMSHQIKWFMKKWPRLTWVYLVTTPTHRP